MTEVHKIIRHTLINLGVKIVSSSERDGSEDKLK